MILVTGTNGFIGSRLCERLGQMQPVRGVVRSAAKATLLPPMVERAVISDLANCEGWSELMRGVDTVVHLAAKVPVPSPFGTRMRDFLRINHEATLRLACAASLHGVKRLIYLSTAQVHGVGRAEPYQESDPFKPESAYALSKCQAEAALDQLSRESGLETVVLRPPLVYGPGVKGKFFRLLGAIARGLPLPFGAMTAPRSMISLDNLVDVLTKFIAHPPPIGGHYLVRDGEDISIQDLARRLATCLEVKPRLFTLSVLEAMAGRMARPFHVDDRLVRRTLDWVPPQTLDEGLLQTVLWYRQANA